VNNCKLVARKFSGDRALILQALRTLKHWDHIGALPQKRAREWRRLLNDARKTSEGMKNLQAILAGRTEADRRLLDFAPFAGILTRNERRKVFLKCVYNH
jgi:hypothetical protein